MKILVLLLAIGLLITNWSTNAKAEAEEVDGTYNGIGPVVVPQYGSPMWGLQNELIGYSTVGDVAEEHYADLRFDFNYLDFSDGDSRTTVVYEGPDQDGNHIFNTYYQQAIGQTTKVSTTIVQASQTTPTDYLTNSYNAAAGNVTGNSSPGDGGGAGGVGGGGAPAHDEE